MPSFKKLALIANRDINQNIHGDGGDGGDGDGPQKIPPAVFEKRAGGKIKKNMKF